jgi:short-chain fatty acids transporter
MIGRLGLAISRVAERVVPDPFVLAIALTLLTAVLALIVPPLAGRENAPGALELLDAWRADDGLWRFLAFGMQMCLILVTGFALARARLAAVVIERLAAWPRSTGSAAALVGLVACLTALINWGLGLIVGALLAREVGTSLSRRGIRAHYPLLCAAGYMGLLVWHGGLSGSAPLSMTTAQGAAKVLPAEAMATLRAQVRPGSDPEQGIPLTETIGSPLNLLITGGLVLGVPLLLMLLAPRSAEDMRPIDRFDVPAALSESSGSGPTRRGLAAHLESSPVVAWALGVPLLLAVVRYLVREGAAQIDLNTINTAMIGLGLLLHGSARAYMSAVADGARGCAGIIIQFPLYAGIMAMMSAAGLVVLCASGLNEIGSPRTAPFLSFLSAALVNLFVPSGGGQWGIQGPVALEAGLAAGVPAGRMVMAVAYGDQLTNMLQPFWALPLLAITGARARDIVGYTAIVMVAAGVWMGLGLLVL